MNTKLTILEIQESIHKEHSEPFVYHTPIENLVLFQRPKYDDERGSFQEWWRVHDIEKEIGDPLAIVQSQLTVTKSGNLRGVHCEPMVKLITPIRIHHAKLFCTLVDLRPNSPTFKHWVQIEFEEKDEKEQAAVIVVPKYFGNSFCVVPNGSDGFVEYLYSQTEYYNPELKDCGLQWDDQELAINWPIGNPSLSERDKQLLDFGSFIKKYR